MHHPRRLGRLVAVGAVMTAMFLIPGPVLADHGGQALFDCSAPPPLEQAISSTDLAFVGAVVATEYNGRSATVAVTDVWRGGEMPATVTVLGGQNPAAAMLDDRTFEVGVTYLFLPSVIDDRLVDSICSATVPWTDDFAALRPVNAQSSAPTVGPTATGPMAVLGELVIPILTAVLIGGAALVVALVVGRRRDT